MRAGGRLASPLGLCSASAAPPPLRLPEQSAPGSPAPGYKRREGEGRGGERARRQKVTPGEGGRKRVKAAGGGGGGGRGGERVGGVNRERKRGRGLWQVERETKRMRNLSHEQLQPSGIASKTSFPGSLCLEQSPVLRDPSGVVGDSAAPQVCAPRCGSRREAQQRETRGETGVSGSRPGRTQPARWARYLERGQWRGMDTILDTVGTPQVGQSRAGGQGTGKTRAPGASCPHVLPHPPRGCGTRGRNLPHAALGSSSRALSGGARTTCFAANRCGRLIQNQLLQGVATPPPLCSDKRLIAPSDLALSYLLSLGCVG